MVETWMDRIERAVCWYRLIYRSIPSCNCFACTSLVYFWCLQKKHVRQTYIQEELAMQGKSMLTIASIAACNYFPAPRFVKRYGTAPEIPPLPTQDLHILEEGLFSDSHIHRVSLMIEK